MLKYRINKPCLNGFTLKVIAIISMTIDHIGAVIVEAGLLQSWDGEKLTQLLATDYGRFWYLADSILRTLGRVAFPIFCFLLVEGFLHTKNVKRYLLNLSVFALISEIPFDLAIFGRAFNFQYQNIFFTLAIGLLTLIGLKLFEGRGGMTVLVTAAGCLLAMVMKTDYSLIGILMIVSFYKLRSNRKYQFISVGAIAFFESFFYFGAAALSLLPISCYNGERGKTGFKYGFYIYYPAHLLLLFFIRCALSGLA